MLDIIAKNVTQKNPATPVNNGIKRTVLQPTTWYTCPVGKKAKVKGIAQCTGVGGSANATFRVGGINLFRWSSTGLPKDYLQQPLNLDVVTRQLAPFSVELVAGDIIETVQAGGFTNAEFNVYAAFVESEV